uniref:protein-glutamine gamma-glutamyltransferase n=1 Tax=Callorhinchus milii TaxID=7868 RepID=V9K8W8_CALMI
MTANAAELLLGAVDLLCVSNNTNHRTVEIDTQRLLLRRGQSFHLAVDFKARGFQKGEDQLSVILETGPEPTVANGTRIEMASGVNSGNWSFSLQSVPGQLNLTIHSSANAVIGYYKMYLLLSSKEGRPIQRIVAGHFYLLFNPWCKEDAVYLGDQDLLQEYVMNENGMLYQGSVADIYSLPWTFGQFEKDVVDICFKILDNSPSALKSLSHDVAKRNDPVYICRTVSAMVNSNDDNGVLSGRWDGNYSGGTPPTKWTGSHSILRMWSSSGTQAVRYGQCWVFAAVTCTVLRCLGIPTRCITNFCSAHDTDGNLQVDRYYSEETLQPLPSEKKDSIWNYHCWVESWMARRDLSSGYDGWQVLDPTPQEKSGGVYCCGPCPVRAIREGDVDVKYDAPFIFAEVNADVVSWLVNRNGSKSEVQVEQNKVGKRISTKSVYDDRREDITNEYKYPEGSVNERKVYTKAGMKLSSISSNKEVKITIKYAQPVLGSDFDVYVSVCNLGFTDRDINLYISAHTVTYNGVILREFIKKTKNFELKAFAVQKEVLRLQYNDYGEHLSEHNMMRLIAAATSNNRSEVTLKKSDIALTLPQLAVKVIGNPILNRELLAQIKFSNPLPITLTKGLFTLEGTGLTDLQEVQSPSEVLPGQEVMVTVPFTPTKAGIRKLMVDFDSNKLHDVKGSAIIIVRPA